MSEKIPLDFPSVASENQPQVDIPAPAPAMKKSDFGFVKIETEGNHTIKIGADDNGSMKLGHQQVEVLPSGPQGGGSFRYSDEKTLYLKKGFHKVEWTYENIAYKPTAKNAAKFEALLDGTQIILHDLKGVYFLPVEESPRGFDPVPFAAMGYIEEGEGGKTPFDVRKGVLFGNSREPNVPVVPESMVGSCFFIPPSMNTDESGFAKFSIQTTGDTEEVQIKVNKIQGSKVILKPVVFKAPFHLTVYYTPKESGFPEDEPKAKLTVAGVVVEVSSLFIDTVIMEGCGLLKNPPDITNPYIGNVKWKNKATKTDATAEAWSAPLGARNRKLIPLVSCAANLAQFSLGNKVQIEPRVAALFKGNDIWTVDDVGERIKNNELDLYWGEDDPSALSPVIPAGLPQGLNEWKTKITLFKKQ